MVLARETELRQVAEISKRIKESKFVVRRGIWYSWRCLLMVHFVWLFQENVILVWTILTIPPIGELACNLAEGATEYKILTMK